MFLGQYEESLKYYKKWFERLWNKAKGAYAKASATAC